jgi:hypothetical protein
MWKLLIRNNARCGYKCNCNETSDVTHILFQCERVDIDRRVLWNRVLEKMPEAMAEHFDTLTPHNKMCFIYSCLNGEPLSEWIELYRAFAEFIGGISNIWYAQVG